MSETIKPALSAEEWANGSKESPLRGPSEVVFLERSNDGVVHLGIRSHDTWRGEKYTGAILNSAAMMAALIALANAALPDDDPRKITRARVDLLREVAASHEKEPGGDWYADVVPLRALADALESYLPLEDTTPPAEKVSFRRMP